MTQTALAIYEDGTLRLLTPLDLPEHAHVQVQVEVVENESAQPDENVLQHLLRIATDPDVDDSHKLHSRHSLSPATDPDPVLALIGAYTNAHSLIDDIPVSEDPDLYVAAESLGEQAAGKHAWEIAPARYAPGPDGRPVRRNAAEGER